MEVHPYASIFPEMPAKDFADLCEDIRAHGLQQPIVTYQGKILDGRHRGRACKEVGQTPRYEVFTGSDIDAIDFVVSLNRHRRHLEPSQAATTSIKAESFRIEARRAAAVRKTEGQKRGGGDRKSEAAKQNRLVERIPPSDPEPSKSRDTIGAAFGVNGRYVDEAAKLHDKAPDLFEKVHAGELNIPQAKREAIRREKKAALEIKAKEAETAVFAGGTKRDLGWEIITGDCIEVLESTEIHRPRLIFADPPYNIGINYGDHYDDCQDDDEYIQWATRWVKACARIMAPDGSFWLLVSDEYAAEYGCLIKDAGLVIRSWIIWYESFGVNCSNKFNRTHRHLFYAVKDARNFVFNTEAVTRPSDRQTKYGDKRADPGGKVWDDVWGINPLIPRVVDNHPERVPDFPTQLPLSLLAPIVGCASDPGDLILDPFNGSGTTGVAAIRAGRRYVGIELSEGFASVARKRLMSVSGELINAAG